MKLPAEALLQMSDQDNERIASSHDGRSRWTMVLEGDGSSGKAKIIRADRPTTLYRGQTQHYDPCWSTFSRGFNEHQYSASELSDEDQAHLLWGLSINNWFHAEVSRHPMVDWFRQQNLVLDTIAIGQHYGIPTGYVDLSESLEVSAFFATCFYDKDDGDWKAEADGEGVMYRLATQAIYDRAQPICHQPFPRPTAQWGWTLELLMGEDFLFAPSLQSFRFNHERSVGEEFLRRFDNGKKLLPYDPSVRLAEDICRASELPIEFVEEAEEQLSEDPSGFSSDAIKAVRQKMIEHKSVTISQTSNVTYSDEEMIDARSDWDVRHRKFYESVGFHLVRTTPLDTP